MSMRRLWAIARKEFLQVVRDPRSLGMAIAIPMLMLLLFGVALTLDVDRVPMMVWDQSSTPASRELISRFSGSRYFSVRAYATNYRQIEHSIDANEVLVALVVPRDFAASIQTEQSTPVQLIVDGSDANTATIASGYADTVAQAYSQDLQLQRLQRIGGRMIRAPLEVRPRVWFNEELQSRNYIIPGLIAMIMMIIAALLTSLTVAREWERGTMEQLISTPVKGSELILGKLLPYFVIGIFDVLIAVLMGEFLFHIPLRGSVILLFLMASIFLVGALSIGLLISIVTKSQLLANQLAVVVTYLPSFLLAGLVFAIANMPWPIRMVTYIVPARYFMSLLRGIYLKGLGLRELAVQALLLSLFSLAVLALAVRKFKKRLE